MSASPTFTSPILQKVYDDYAGNISKPEERKRFEDAFRSATTLEDVVQTVNKAQKSAENKKSHKFLMKLNQAFQWIRENREVMETLAQINGLIGCSIWGPIKLIVNVVWKSQEVVEKLCTLVTRLRLNAIICRKYEEIHGQNQLVKDSLTDFYKDIVHFAALAVGHFEKSNAKHFFRHFAKPAMSQFDAVIENLKDHCEMVKETSKVAEMEESRDHRNDQKKESARKEAKKVREWLNPQHHHTSQQKKQASDKTAGTCTWFLSRPEFASWSSPSASDKRLLWVHGKPGCGKSYLASAAIQNLSDQKLQPIYYFYNQKEARETFHQSAIGFLGAFLFQLFETNSDGVRETITASWRKAPENRDKVSNFDYLEQLLNECLPKIDGRVFCVVDALDECENIKPLMDCITNTLKNSEKIKFCVTSRDEPKIRQGFEPLCEKKDSVGMEIAVENKDVEKDIKRYFDAKADSWNDEKKTKSGIMGEIDGLVVRSEGMFLWARLMMDVLDQTNTTAEIQSILKDTSTGLSGMYEFIFSRIINNCSCSVVKVSQNVLKWVTTAKSALTVDQIRVALAVHEHDIENDKDFDDDKMIYGGSFRKVMLDACGPLLDVSADGKLNVVHLTVKEFLFTPCEGEKEYSGWICGEGDANAELAITSLKMLSFDRYLISNTVNEKGESTNPEDSNEVPDVFFRYVATHWHEHATASATAGNARKVYDLAKEYVNSDRCYQWTTFIWSQLTAYEYEDIQYRLTTWSEAVTHNDGERDTTFDNIMSKIVQRQYEALTADPDAKETEYLYNSMRSRAEEHIFKHEYEEAVEIETKLVDMMAKNPTYGHESKTVANCMRGLGTTLWRSKRYDEAEGVLVKCLDLHKKIYGESHDETIIVMGLLVCTYSAQGRVEEAEKYEAEVLTEIRKRNAESPTESSAIAAFALAGNFFDMKRYKESAELYETAIDVLLELHGVEHAETQYMMRDLSECYFTWNDPEGYYKKVILDRKVYEMWREKYGEDHPHTLNSMEALADACNELAYYKVGKTMQVEYLQEAKRLLEHVIAVRKKLNGEEAEQSLTTMGDLSYVLQLLARHIGKDNGGSEELHYAEDLMLFVLKTRQKQLGNYQESTLRAMRDLACVYRAGFAWECVEELERHVYKVRKKELGMEDWSTEAARDGWVEALREQGKDKEADEVLRGEEEKQQETVEESKEIEELLVAQESKEGEKTTEIKLLSQAEGQETKLTKKKMEKYLTRVREKRGKGKGKGKGKEKGKGKGKETAKPKDEEAEKEIRQPKEAATVKRAVKRTTTWIYRPEETDDERKASRIRRSVTLLA